MNDRIKSPEPVACHPKAIANARDGLVYTSDRVGALRVLLEELGLEDKDAIPWVLFDIDRSIRSVRMELDADPPNPFRQPVPAEHEPETDTFTLAKEAVHYLETLDGIPRSEARELVMFGLGDLRSATAGDIYLEALKRRAGWPGEPATTSSNVQGKRGGSAPSANSASVDTRWLDEHWNDLREYTDGALQLIGSMPVAIRAAADDPEHLQELLVKLSDQLTALSDHVGEFRPGTEPNWDEKPTERQPEVVS